MARACRPRKRAAGDRSRRSRRGLGAGSDENGVRFPSRPLPTSFTSRLGRSPKACFAAPPEGSRRTAFSPSTVPFRWHGSHVSDSNQVFDASLRARDETWGVRDIDDIDQLAASRRLTRVDGGDAGQQSPSVLRAREGADAFFRRSGGDVDDKPVRMSQDDRRIRDVSARACSVSFGAWSVSLATDVLRQSRNQTGAKRSRRKS